MLRKRTLFLAIGLVALSTSCATTNQELGRKKARAKQELSVPVAAIGGINADNAAQVAAAGADLLAVINYLFASQDIALRARELSSLFQRIQQT